MAARAHLRPSGSLLRLEEISQSDHVDESHLVSGQVREGDESTAMVLRRLYECLAHDVPVRLLTRPQPEADCAEVDQHTEACERTISGSTRLLEKSSVGRVDHHVRNHGTRNEVLQ